LKEEPFKAMKRVHSHYSATDSSITNRVTFHRDGCKSEAKKRSQVNPRPPPSPSTLSLHPLPPPSCLLTPRRSLIGLFRPRSPFVHIRPALVWLKTARAAAQPSRLFKNANKQQGGPTRVPTSCLLISSASAARKRQGPGGRGARRGQGGRPKYRTVRRSTSPGEDAQSEVVALLRRRVSQSRPEEGAGNGTGPAGAAGGLRQAM